MEPKGFYVVHQGQAFAAKGGGLFAKDVVSVGKRLHPATGRMVEFDRDRIDRLVAATEKYLKNGNTIPFPKGHTVDPLENLGTWPGPFIRSGDDFVGVVEPKDPKAAKGIETGALDFVSAFIEKDVTDPAGQHYAEVPTHICATNYPVWTGQKSFVALSREVFTKTKAELYLPEALASESDQGDDDTHDPLDLQAAHDRLQADMKKHAKAYGKSYAENGADHKDTMGHADKLRIATRRLANHANLMAKHVENTTTDHAYVPPMAKVSIAQALEELAHEADPAAIAAALEDLAKNNGG